MWLMLIFAVGPEPIALVETVAMCETNHYYDCNANHVFTQNIYYDGEGNVLAWHLVKQLEHKPIAGRITFFDGSYLRRIDARRVCESYTQHDPELESRSILSTEQRRGLSPVMSTKRAKELLQGDR